MLSIVQPLAFTVDQGRSSGGAGLGNLATPSPREAFAAAAAQATIVLDLGSAQAVDRIVLGFTTAAATDGFSVVPGLDGAAVAGVFAHSYRRAPVLRHGLCVLPAPVTTRYLQLKVAAAAPIRAGIAVVGLAMRTAFEHGSGRPLVDTGRSERLSSGGFGGEPGAVAGGFAWTMVDLPDPMRDRLYAMQLDLGTTGDFLAIEDEAGTEGLNERIHWGRFPKLETFERQADGTSKLPMAIGDWA
ncbi:hypothetical protein [Sphingomonas sp. SORGH_AS_0879]|uniref:hypothetical protein n=1 Tax=Sphingomonas sp. SORGH_AS_0879 TaxID=3041790 RepID=UPI00277FF86B|nr:hypothetical protein [Sphingomonas sp. SORGH_AS_0879]MDQ1229263.1 hypothetical protein [Sphingomonas sp. SORGH_AS_0879]